MKLAQRQSVESVFLLIDVQYFFFNRGLYIILWFGLHTQNPDSSVGEALPAASENKTHERGENQSAEVWTLKKK